MSAIWIEPSGLADGVTGIVGDVDGNSEPGGDAVGPPEALALGVGVGLAGGVSVGVDEGRVDDVAEAEGDTVIVAVGELTAVAVAVASGVAEASGVAVGTGTTETELVSVAVWLMTMSRRPSLEPKTLSGLVWIWTGWSSTGAPDGHEMTPFGQTA